METPPSGIPAEAQADDRLVDGAVAVVAANMPEAEELAGGQLDGFRIGGRAGAAPALPGRCGREVEEESSILSMT